MNYNSIQEILSAGTTNMTVLRNNSKQDDGTDTITGVSWFTYDGKVASQIYASGNSFIGFGTSTEHLRVNRRDGALWYLYREEGTLYGHYKFLKIRWKGYSVYSATSSTYAIEYDVILWDTGDISLHMVSIPTSNNNGTYSLTASSTTRTYTVSTSSPDITFTKTDSGFSINNSLINLPLPSYYLIRSGSTYYTVVDGVLNNITVTALTSDIFMNSGTTDIPPLSLLTNLTNPEILVWKNEDFQLTDGLIIQGTPTLPQIIYYDTQNMSNHIGIESVVCLASADALFAISIDEGQTWKYYNNETWNDVTTDLDGMDANTVHSITSDKWAELVTSSTPYKFRCALPSLTSNVRKIYVKHKEGVI